VRHEVSTKVRSTNSSVRSLLRGTGRVAIWTVLGLLLIRGVLAEPSAAPQAPNRATVGVDPKSAAFAVRFARTYLADPTAAALSPFVAEGVSVGTGRPPEAGSADVAQAEVSESRDLGGGRAVLTVACELRDARVLYLAVPIVRSEAGEVAALGAPSIVAAPGAAGADSNERPQPLAGSDAGAIQALVSKFLPEYVSASDGGSLSYLLAPGTVVQPLGGAVQLARITGVTQLDSGEGPRRTVLVAARVGDPTSGATYPVAYRLELVKHGRWYLESVEGAAS
jgi:Conjugative transposon protein TcpC